MKKGWTTTKLVAAGSLAALALILQLFGAGIAAASGIPLTSGFINVLVLPAILLLTCFVVDIFGAATLMLFILTVLEVPLPLGGAPGFLPKIPINIVAGLIIDVLYFALNGRRIFGLPFVIVVGGVFEFYSLLVIIWVGRLVGMPGIEATAKLFLNPLMIAGAFVGGMIGGYLGWLIYLRAKDSNVVKRIHGE